MNETFTDVEYQENIQENDDKNQIINGEPLFYTTLQCANMLNEPPSCIRYWSKRFESLLDIEVSNRNKQYKKSDINKLKFIQKLIRDDGLTLQQVDSYCQRKDFNMKDIENAVLDINNPLAVQTFISAVTVELEKKFENFAETILKEMGEKNKEYAQIQQEAYDKLNENIVTTVDEVVSEKLDSKLSDLKSYIDTKEQEAKIRDIEMIDTLKENMNKRKEEATKEKKGIFGKIFGK